MHTMHIVYDMSVHNVCKVHRVHSVYLSVPLEPCNKELKFATAEAKNRWDSNTQTLERILQY